MFFMAVVVLSGSSLSFLVYFHHQVIRYEFHVSRTRDKLKDLDRKEWLLGL